MSSSELEAMAPLAAAPPAAPPGPRFALASRTRAAHAVGLALLHAFAFFVAAPVLVAAAGAGGGLFVASPRTLVVLVIAASVDAAAVIGLGLLRFGRVSLASLGWRSPNLTRSLMLAAAGAVACVGVAAALWLGAAPDRDLAGFGAAIAAPSPDERILFVLIGLHAAFVEETIFRGYLQPSLVARWGPWLGLAATALIFALYHLNPRPIALGGKLAFGLVFGALRARDDSVVAPALAHALLWGVLGAL